MIFDTCFCGEKIIKSLYFHFYRCKNYPFDNNFHITFTFRKNKIYDIEYVLNNNSLYIYNDKTNIEFVNKKIDVLIADIKDYSIDNIIKTINVVAENLIFK